MGRRVTSLINAFWFALLIAFCVLCFIAVPRSLLAADLTIAHVTVVSPETSSAVRNAVVRVHDGRIVSVKSEVDDTADAKADATVIDGTGMYLAPGLIDSHVHLSAIPGMTDEQEAAHPDIAAAARSQIPRSYLLMGFTTLIDLISAPEGMARWRQSSDAVPDTYFCGGAALMDGYSMNYEPKPQRYHDWPYMLIESDMQAPAGIDAAMHTPQAVVSRMKSDGAICVKTFFERGFAGVKDLPVPKIDTIRELVRAAHAVGLPVLMHANSDEAQRFALDCRVDIVAHGLWAWNQQHTSTAGITPGIRQILDRELAANVGWQPTLQVLYGLRAQFDIGFLSDPQLQRVLPSSLIDWYRSPEGGWFRRSMLEEAPLPAGSDTSRLGATLLSLPIQRARNTTAYLIAHHGRILFGTDTPSAPTYGNPPGLNALMEMRHLLEAGESPAQIFRSATLANAQALKLDRDIGTVQAGKRANLLLLRQDPTQTIDAYNDIVKVILNGRVLDPAELAANAKR
jgi:imidazolonepropionase-like amidohydrolase